VAVTEIDEMKSLILYHLKRKGAMRAVVLMRRRWGKMRKMIPGKMVSMT
jgi:hypothetical protein